MLVSPRASPYKFGKGLNGRNAIRGLWLLLPRVLGASSSPAPFGASQTSSIRTLSSRTVALMPPILRLGGGFHARGGVDGKADDLGMVVHGTRGMSSTTSTSEGGGEGKKQSSMRSLVEDFSIEVTTSLAKKVSNFSKILPQGTRVYIASLSTTDPADVDALCSRLVGDGMCPVPHIAARGIVSESALEETVKALSRNGVTRVLLISGDYAVPAGSLTCAMDVCESGVLQKHGITHVDVAGHPEGSKNVPSPFEALSQKVAWARDNGINMSIVTQVCFDAPVVCEYIAKLRSAGVSNRVIVGVAGPTKLDNLTKMASSLGIGPSTLLLYSQPGLVAQLVAMNDPGLFLAKLSEGLVVSGSGSTDGGGIGLHGYSFGGFEPTARWFRSVADQNQTADAS